MKTKQKNGPLDCPFYGLDEIDSDVVGAGWAHWNLIKAELIKCWHIVQEVKSNPELIVHGA